MTDSSVSGVPKKNGVQPIIQLNMLFQFVAND